MSASPHCPFLSSLRHGKFQMSSHAGDVLESVRVHLTRAGCMNLCPSCVQWLHLGSLKLALGFCHTLTWISHGFTCVPHPDPPSCTLRHLKTLCFSFLSILLIKFPKCSGILGCSVQHVLCPTLCNPKDCSPPGSSVHGIFQARILEWVAVSNSMGSSLTQKVNPYLLYWKAILYHGATSEAPCRDIKQHKFIIFLDILSLSWIIQDSHLQVFESIPSVKVLLPRKVTPSQVLEIRTSCLECCHSVYHTPKSET